MKSEFDVRHGKEAGVLFLASAEGRRWRLVIAARGTTFGSVPEEDDMVDLNSAEFRNRAEFTDEEVLTELKEALAKKGSPPDEIENIARSILAELSAVIPEEEGEFGRSMAEAMACGRRRAAMSGNTDVAEIVASLRALARRTLPRGSPESAGYLEKLRAKVAADSAFIRKRLSEGGSEDPELKAFLLAADPSLKPALESLVATEADLLGSQKRAQASADFERSMKAYVEAPDPIPAALAAWFASQPEGIQTSLVSTRGSVARTRAMRRQQRFALVALGGLGVLVVVGLGKACAPATPEERARREARFERARIEREADQLTIDQCIRQGNSKAWCEERLEVLHRTGH